MSARRSAFVALAAASLLAPTSVLAATFFSRAAANWNVNTTWSTAACGGAAAASTPTAADDVQICNGQDVTIPAGFAAAANSVTILSNNGNGRLIHAAATSTIAVGAGGVTINAPSNNNTNEWRIDAGSATVAGPVTLNEGTSNARIASMRLTTGSLSVTGDLVMNNASADIRTSISLTGAASITVTGSFSLVGGFGTLTPSTNTSTFTFSSGSAATIASGTAIAYPNLTVNKPGGTATLTGNETVSGNLTVSAGTLDLGAFTLNRSAAGGTLTVSNGATLKIGGTNGFPANYTTHSLGTTLPTCSIVDYAGTAQTVSLESYGNLSLSGSGVKTMPGAAMTVACDLTLSGTATATAGNALTVGRDMTIGAGTTFSASTFTHNVARNFSNNGATFNANTSTLNLNGAAAQTLGGTTSTTFNNLTIANTVGGVSLGVNETVNATLTLTSGTLATGSNKLSIAAAGTVSPVRTASVAGATNQVLGNVEKAFDATHLSFTYPIGDGTNFTPITVAFSALTTAGNLTATTPSAPADHPDTTGGRTGIDPTKSVNRYWILKNSTAAGTYDATLNYLAADLDSATPTNVGRGESCATSGGVRTCNPWGLPSVSGAPTTTRAIATALLLANSDLDADLVAGQTTAARFVRQKEFIYNRERY